MDASAKKDAKADADVPDSFLCPLTQEVMREPVVDPEGNTYERSAIEAWLEKNNTSPITRKTLRREELVPNRALRDVIAEHYKSKVRPEHRTVVVSMECCVSQGRRIRSDDYHSSPTFQSSIFSVFPTLHLPRRRWPIANSMIGSRSPATTARGEARRGCRPW